MKKIIIATIFALSPMANASSMCETAELATSASKLLTRYIDVSEAKTPADVARSAKRTMASLRTNLKQNGCDLNQIPARILGKLDHDIESLESESLEVAEKNREIYMDAHYGVALVIDSIPDVLLP